MTGFEVGDRVEVYVPRGRRLRGTVERISRSATTTYDAVKVRFDNDPANHLNCPRMAVVKLSLLEVLAEQLE